MRLEDTKESQSEGVDIHGPLYSRWSFWVSVEQSLHHEKNVSVVEEREHTVFVEGVWSKS